MKAGGRMTGQKKYVRKNPMRSSKGFRENQACYGDMGRRESKDEPEMITGIREKRMLSVT